MIIGLDEAGRGCWAGPLVAAAVLLNRDIPGLTDSKKLTKIKRTQLAGEIKQKAVAYGVGWVYPAEIDEIGLTAATQKAMREALQQIRCDYDQIIIDGNLNYLPGFTKVTTLIKADATVPAVSAASIIAKTERDNYMRDISVHYPNYQFDKHVGYGTALHMELLKLHGICELHRLSYKPVKALL